MQWRFERLRPRLAGLTYQYAYDYSDIPWLLGGRDLVVVPSVWWDNAPQTVFEAFGCGVPVLGAELGGIPDFVTHGHNGLLFRGNDRYDLARRLAECVREPAALDRLRANVRPPKSIADHGTEIEALYHELLCSDSTPPALPPTTRPASRGVQPTGAAE
jgi:glycosyltransferase involved in cell wall biosynthesis